MSPAGISMLYCAREEATALEETVDPKRAHGKVACIGTFRVREPSGVVDLRRLPPVPSIFEELDAEMHRRRAELSFLHGFARDLSRPSSATTGSTSSTCPRR